MKQRLFLILVGMVLTIPICTAEDVKTSVGARTIERLASTPLEWHLPREGRDYRKRVLPSGVTVYLWPDHTIPLVSVYGVLRAGALFEPVDHPQLAKITAAMVRESGTGEVRPDALNSMLDFASAELHLTTGPDLVEIEGSVPTRHLETLLKAMGGLLSRPAFSPERLRYVVQRTILSEATAAEDPFYLCRRTFYEIVYAGHPYARLYSAEGADKVSLEDVRDFFRRHYFPANLTLVITGDFQTDNLLSAWERFYRDPPANGKLETPPVPSPEYHPGVYLVQRNINQSSIYFGRQEVAADTPEVLRIQLLNHMLGGSSFASRFTQEIRDKEGLAYRVDSIFETDRLGRGAFIARCRTKTRSTIRALDAMLWIISLFRDGRIPHQEFLVGRDGLRNGFVKRFDTLQNILRNELMLELLGRPPGFLADYRSGVAAITPEELQSIARKTLDPARMTYVVVGNVAAMADQFRKYGQVHLVGSSATPTEPATAK